MISFVKSGKCLGSPCVDFPGRELISFHFLFYSLGVRLFWSAVWNIHIYQCGNPLVDLAWWNILLECALLINGPGYSFKPFERRRRYKSADVIFYLRSSITHAFLNNLNICIEIHFTKSVQALIFENHSAYSLNIFIN